MSTIITDHQMGLLCKNGCFQKFLLPGKYHYAQAFGYSITPVEARGAVDTRSFPLEVLCQDPAYAQYLTVIEVPDHALALHYIDNRLTDTLTSGRHLYWSRFEQHTGTLLDMSEPQVANTLPLDVFNLIPQHLFLRITVPPGQVCLLYFDRKLTETLQPGNYFFWNRQTEITAQLYDLRLQPLEINGQEILSADKVSLRLNFTCTYQILDPVALDHDIKDYKMQLYVYTQLILREYIGQYKFDDILAQKDDIARVVLAKLQEQQQLYHVRFTAAGIKDIILPGEIRDIMNTVLLAEKRAQANVITRREEVASTRSLLNTAKLMEENATLYKLKELECLEKICDKVGSISVNGGDNLLAQLNSLLSARS